MTQAIRLGRFARLYRTACNMEDASVSKPADRILPQCYLFFWFAKVSLAVFKYLSAPLFWNAFT